MSACPALSIVINNFNYEAYLAEALDRSLAQMEAQDELIVVDDGSSDGSLGILKEYEQAHGIRLIAQENQGQLRAVFNGLAAATGDVVVLLDSDDYFLDGYLSRLRHLYRDRPQIDYVFAAARLSGRHKDKIKQIHRILQQLELPAGEVGETKWAALTFQEYVGIPTSGNSFTRKLAGDIMTLAENFEARVALSPALARLVGVSATESKNSGYSADGVIVRCASILNARKYYDDRPGFIYRIHGDNKYAASTGLGRWYLRQVRKKHFSAMVRRDKELEAFPSTGQLHQEVLQRSFARQLRRRIIIRGHYCLAILRSRGTPGDKLRALAATLFAGAAKP